MSNENMNPSNDKIQRKGAVKSGLFSGKYVFVTIHKDSSTDGKEDVALGVEGRVLKIKRGERVRIPVEHFEHLESCTYDTVDQFGDVVGQVPRFSFSFHGDAPAA